WSFTLSTPAPTAGTAFNETVTAQDEYSNTATGYTGAKAIVFAGPSNSPNNTAPTYPASSTFSAGIATPSITLTDAQSTTLSATQGLITGTSASFPVAAGSTTRFTLSAPAPTAGVAFNETIAAGDSYANATTSYTGAQGTITGTSASFTVAGGALGTLTVPTPSSPQTAGTSFTVTVHATDTDGN